MEGICTYAPLLIFAYDRPAHLKKCLESVNDNPEAKYTELSIFIDASASEKNFELVESVKRVAEKFANECRFRKVDIHFAEKLSTI